MAESRKIFPARAPSARWQAERQPLASPGALRRSRRRRGELNRSILDRCHPVALQVPLTQSLYVPGKIIEADKMLVDVGTGYYVEKNQEKTKEFLGRKVRSGGCLRDAPAGAKWRQTEPFRSAGRGGRGHGARGRCWCAWKAQSHVI